MQSNEDDLRNIIHHLRTITSQLRPVKNITFGEYNVLCVIGQSLDLNPSYGLTPTKLNDIMGTKKPATSRTLTMLEKKGYIVREVSMKDHRISSLKITKSGYEILSEGSETYKKLGQRVVERMGREEFSHMLAAMVKFGRILEEELE